MLLFAYLYWRWGLAPVSRRLIGAKKGMEATQKDLPYELRGRYEAVAVLGSGAFGVVIDAWQLSGGTRTIRRAVKVVHARHGKLDEKDLRRLHREVNSAFVENKPSATFGCCPSIVFPRVLCISEPAHDRLPFSAQWIRRTSSSILSQEHRIVRMCFGLSWSCCRARRWKTCKG